MEWKLLVSDKLQKLRKINSEYVKLSNSNNLTIEQHKQLIIKCLELFEFKQDSHSIWIREWSKLVENGITQIRFYDKLNEIKFSNFFNEISVDTIYGCFSREIDYGKVFYDLYNIYELFDPNLKKEWDKFYDNKRKREQK